MTSKTLRNALLSAALMAGVSAFATLAAAQEQAPAPPAEAAPAAAPAEAPAPAATPAKPAPKGAVTVAAPPEGQGQIVFFRPSKLLGMAIGFKVREDKTELCTLNNGWYCILPIAPGTHKYVVHSEVKDELTIEVEPGETYYVQGTLGMGVVAGRPNLSPSSKETFDSMSAKLKADPKAGAYPPPKP